MGDEKYPDEGFESVKQRIIDHEGWFIPALHEKYVKKIAPSAL